MGFIESVQTCLRKYATFDGRAGRSEFWWFVLFTIVASMVVGMVSEMLSGLVSLALFVPSIAVGARRLHDIGKSGWLQLLWIVPVIGWVLLIYWAVQPSGAANGHGQGPELAPGAPVGIPPGA
jgi:uncharacterized membrane protein YhaH (DUF805 family)